MKRLLLLDYKNYTDDMPVFEKNSVRAIIEKDGKIAMQKSKSGEFKILGGVVEDGESHLETIVREVEEEGGLLVIPDSVEEIGYIEERRRDVFHKDRVYICHTYFYRCKIKNETVALKLTEEEMAKGYQLAWEEPQKIVDNNQKIIHEAWKMRDTEFIKMLAEGKIS